VLLYALRQAFGFNGVISSQTAANYIALIAAFIVLRIVFRKTTKAVALP
jgi:predicted RND superfamily exporter protein